MKIQSLFISDLHLGSKNNNAIKALKVLRSYKYEKLFLLGDIVDIKAMSQNFKWESAENDVWEFIDKYSEKHPVIYCTGNHERGFFGDVQRINNMEFFRGYEYKDMYLCHGDIFDHNLESNKWPRKLIDVAYNSLSEFNLKIVSQLKKAIRRSPHYLKNFRENAIELAGKYGKKKIVCGHTHQQEHCIINNIDYYNLGDFKEDSSYMIETLEDELILKE